MLTGGLQACTTRNHDFINMSNGNQFRIHIVGVLLEKPGVIPGHCLGSHWDVVGVHYVDEDLDVDVLLTLGCHLLALLTDWLQGSTRLKQLHQAWDECPVDKDIQTDRTSLQLLDYNG